MNKVEIVFTDRAQREGRTIAKYGMPPEGLVCEVDSNTARSLVQQKFAKFKKSAPKKADKPEKED